jgi:hydrogenase-4 component B
VISAGTIAGVTLLASGGALTAIRLRPGLALQAVGLAVLGVSGASAVAGGDTAGAAFRSTVAPAFGVDPLTGFFLAVRAIAGVPALLFGGPYLEGGRNAPRALGTLSAAFLLALVGLVPARDVTTFLGAWELMTVVPAAAILVARRSKEVRDAVFAYLAITHIGGAGVWVALLVLADRGAIGDPAALASAGSGVQTLVAISALVGFGTKAGLIPLHAWLPRAHPVAPAHLSALMSAVMIKVALYGLIRVEFEWLGATPRWLGVALLVLGGVSAAGGVLWAIVQPDLKRLLAYSSIENCGIVVLALGASLLLAGEGEVLWAHIAFGAALLHIANHAVIKALLFLAAGSLERAVGALRLDELGGLLARMPWTGTSFLVGAAAIAGLPPLNGFVSEWLTLRSLLHAAMALPLGLAVAAGLALAVLAAASALAVLAFAKAVGLVLLGQPRRQECADATEADPAMRIALAVLAGLCVVLAATAGLMLPTLAELSPGPGPSLPDSWTLVDIPATGTLPVLVLPVVLTTIVTLLLRARGPRRAAPAPTWACGQQVVPALNWTSAGFSKPLVLVLEGLLRPRRQIEVVEDGGLVQEIHYSGDVPSLADRLLYDPAIQGGLRGAAVMRRLQTGNVRTYAMYLLGLVLVLLTLARVGVLG